MVDVWLTGFALTNCPGASSSRHIVETGDCLQFSASMGMVFPKLRPYNQFWIPVENLGDHWSFDSFASHDFPATLKWRLLEMPKQLFCRSIIDHLVAFLSCFVNDLEEPEEVGACWSMLEHVGAVGWRGGKPIWSWRHCVTKRLTMALRRSFAALAPAPAVSPAFCSALCDVYSLPFLIFKSLMSPPCRHHLARSKRTMPSMFSGNGARMSCKHSTPSWRRVTGLADLQLVQLGTSCSMWRDIFRWRAEDRSSFWATHLWSSSLRDVQNVSQHQNWSNM